MPFKIIPNCGPPPLPPPSLNRVKVSPMSGEFSMFPECSLIISFSPKQARGGGGIRPQAGSSLCCAETVSSRKLKLRDFYYMLIGLNSEYKSIPWGIHCCHGNAIVEGCSVKVWLKSVENCNFLLKSFSDFNLGLLFVYSISKLPPIPNFKQIG